MFIGLRALIYRFLFPSAIPAVLLIVLLLLLLMMMAMVVSNPTLTLARKLYFVFETYRPFCSTVHTLKGTPSKSANIKDLKLLHEAVSRPKTPVEKN